MPIWTGGMRSIRRLVMLAVQEGKGEIDAFQLTQPVLGLRAGAPLEQVGFQLIEAAEPWLTCSMGQRMQATLDHQRWPPSSAPRPRP
jgi:hypothetical protein